MMYDNNAEQYLPTYDWTQKIKGRLVYLSWMRWEPKYNQDCPNNRSTSTSDIFLCVLI